VGRSRDQEFSHRHRDKAELQIEDCRLKIGYLITPLPDYPIDPGSRIKNRGFPEDPGLTIKDQGFDPGVDRENDVIERRLYGVGAAWDLERVIAAGNDVKFGFPQ